MKEALIQYLNDRIDWHKREQSRLKKADVHVPLQFRMIDHITKSLNGAVAVRTLIKAKALGTGIADVEVL